MNGTRKKSMKLDLITEMPMVLCPYHINIPLFGFSCASIELIVIFGISKGTKFKTKINFKLRTLKFAKRVGTIIKYEIIQLSMPFFSPVGNSFFLKRMINVYTKSTDPHGECSGIVQPIEKMVRILTVQFDGAVGFSK